MSLRLSCHCGAVAGTLADAPTTALACNCSICRRRGHLLHFTTPDRFTLDTPRDALTAYTFGKHVIRHLFCRTCGCGVFGEGVGPDGQPALALNLRCAEGLDLDALELQHFDGASLP